MDKDVAAEVGKIAALVARLGYGMQLHPAPDRVWVDDCEGEEIATINITKTRKSRRIPMLRALADKLRAELKEQAKCKP